MVFLEYVSLKLVIGILKLAELFFKFKKKKIYSGKLQNLTQKKKKKRKEKKRKKENFPL